jgi:hypothetical protein
MIHAAKSGAAGDELAAKIKRALTPPSERSKGPLRTGLLSCLRAVVSKRRVESQLQPALIAG